MEKGGSSMKRKRCDDCEGYNKYKEVTYELFKCDDCEGYNKYKEVTYELLKFQDYQVKSSSFNENGGCSFKCPFCEEEEQGDMNYSSLLQHSIQVTEEGPTSLNWKERAKHAAMAAYLAIDLACEAKQDSDLIRPLIQQLAAAQKKEEEAVSNAKELESKIEDMNDEINALIVKERCSNDELQAIRKAFIQGLGDFDKSIYFPMGIKRIGELDPETFINNLPIRGIGRGNIAVKGAELCSQWQNKIIDPLWYPFKIVPDGTGQPKRVLKEEDAELQGLKKKYGKGIYDAVVEALTEIQEHNPSRCSVVPELWNFKEKRKASVDEVARHILQVEAKAKGKRSPIFPQVGVRAKAITRMKS